MCKFKSGIVLQTAGGGFDLLHNPYTDSHEDLVRIFKLNDSARPGGTARFARVEYYPPSMDKADDLSTYTFRIDEQRRPDWFTAEIEEKATAKMKLIISGMIISGDADLLCGGAYILAKGARVASVKSALIHVALGDADIRELWENSQVGVLRGNSKVGVLRENSKVGVLCGNSQVGVLWENSQVGVLRGNSKVGELWENSQVGVLWGNSQVGVLRGNSQVGVLRENSKVGVLWGNSQVGVLRGNSQVGVLWGNSKVGELRGNSKVGELWGNSKVGELWENSQVGVLWENSQVGVLWGNSKVGEDKREKKEAAK